MSQTRRKAASLLAVGSLFLTVCLVGTGGVLAGVTPSASPGAQWAYGAVRTVDFSGVDASGHTYAGSATYGFSVILNETSSTSGNVTNSTVHLNRTIGALISAEYCLGKCSPASELANFSYHAWESFNAWANLTTGGAVTVGSLAVPALALQNSSESVAAYLRESIQLGHGAIPLHYASLFVNVSGAATVALAPPLGLFPLTASLAPGAVWNSSSAYVAVGAAHWSAWVSNWGSAVVHPGNLTTGGSVNLSGSGTVALSGQYPAGSVFSYDRTDFPALNLSVAGPFAVSEGFLLVPADTDLFGGASHPWSASQNGSSVVTSAYVDIHPGAQYQGHLPVVASSAAWLSVGKDAAAALSPSGAPTPLVAPAAASNATVVQAQPESVGQATSDQRCLVTGLGCPTAGAGVPWLRYAIVGGLVVGLAGVLAAIVVARRTMPPPAYPNAQLYPPGATVSPAPAPTRPAPTPAEDDPLGNLW